MPSFSFREITEPYLHGVEATCGARKVQVICSDHCCGEWFCYATIDGRVVKSTPLDPKTKSSCMVWAKKFLKEQINPETW